MKATFDCEGEVAKLTRKLSAKEEQSKVRCMKQTFFKGGRKNLDLTVALTKGVSYGWPGIWQGKTKR